MLLLLLPLLPLPLPLQYLEIIYHTITRICRQI
jgi:hypothetical protein